ncbi:armadillo-type protein [Syncephalis plumigaleata]|nr:armadillo-type protein [Syncephalis plumigaleata]
MDKLLKWAVINSSTEKEDPTKPSAPRRTLTDLDPGIIDAILGKDDATLMREIMDQLEDNQVSLDNKEVLMENFEMLVGHVDNALNMEPLQMWPRLLALIQSDEAVLRSGALWIAGTCVQNNPKAKVVFIKENGLQYALDRLEKDTTTSVRAKALYCLSSLLQNAPPTIELFVAKDGYTVMLNLLQSDKYATLHARTLFLFHQLALQCPEEHIPQMHQMPFADTIASLVASQPDNEDIVEKVMEKYI